MKLDRYVLPFQITFFVLLTLIVIRLWQQPSFELFEAVRLGLPFAWFVVVGVLIIITERFIARRSETETDRQRYILGNAEAWVWAQRLGALLWFAAVCCAGAGLVLYLPTAPGSTIVLLRQMVAGSATILGGTALMLVGVLAWAYRWVEREHGEPFQTIFERTARSDGKPASDRRFAESDQGMFSFIEYITLLCGLIIVVATLGVQFWVVLIIIGSLGAGLLLLIASILSEE